MHTDLIVNRSYAVEDLLPCGALLSGYKCARWSRLVRRYCHSLYPACDSRDPVTAAVVRTAIKKTCAAALGVLQHSQHILVQLATLLSCTRLAPVATTLKLVPQQGGPP